MRLAPGNTLLEQLLWVSLICIELLLDFPVRWHFINSFREINDSPLESLQTGGVYYSPVQNCRQTCCSDMNCSSSDWRPMAIKHKNGTRIFRPLWRSTFLDLFAGTVLGMIRFYKGLVSGCRVRIGHGQIFRVVVHDPFRISPISWESIHSITCMISKLKRMILHLQYSGNPPLIQALNHLYFTLSSYCNLYWSLNFMSSDGWNRLLTCLISIEPLSTVQLVVDH